MDSTTLMILVGAIIVIAAVGFFFWQRQRSSNLRKQFGPEYERTVREVGDQRRAEKELEKRQKRVDALDLHALSLEDRRRYGEEWRKTQANFVDDPSKAVEQADQLVKQLMQARGYPMGNFEQRTADISVHYPELVENYRAARDIAERNRKGQASTEDLRHAMVYYKRLFEELLHEEAKTKHEKEEVIEEGVR